MMPDLLSLVRQEYAKLHPERDTRAMEFDDDYLALVAAVEGVFDRMQKQLDRLEKKLAAKDPE